MDGPKIYLLLKVYNARDKIEVATECGVSQGSEMLAINNRINGILGGEYHARWARLLGG